MRLVQQPFKSRQCGQACLAMVLGISLEEACRLVGHKHGTSTKRLVKTLRAQGYECRDRLSRLPKQMPELAICKVTWPHTSSSHWVVWAEGGIWDPWPLPLSYGWRITSCLEIRRSTALLPEAA